MTEQVGARGNLGLSSTMASTVAHGVRAETSLGTGTWLFLQNKATAARVTVKNMVQLARAKALIAAGPQESFEDLLVKGLSVAYLACVAASIIWSVVSYNFSFLQKMRQIQETRDRLKNNVHCCLAELESLLGRILQSSARLAEQNFEDKRRDFLKFLRWVLENPSHFDDPRVFVLFRSIILQWLAVFTECTMDPLNHPRVIANERDLMELDSVVRLAAYVGAQLERSGVAFISQELETVAAPPAQRVPGQRRKTMMRSLRSVHANCRTHVQLGLPSFSWLFNGGSDSQRASDSSSHVGGHWASGPSGDATQGSGGATQNQDSDDSWDSQCASSSSEYSKATEEHSKPEENTMLMWRRAAKAIVKRGLAPQETPAYAREVNSGLFPIGITLCSSGFVIKSASHLFELVLPIVIGLLLMSFDIMANHMNYAVFVGIGAFCDLLNFVLGPTEDSLTAIEQEVTNLQKDMGIVLERKQRIDALYAGLHPLADLWLLRTVPHLEMLTEVHQAIRHAEEEDVLDLMERSTTLLERVARSLGPVSIWIGEQAFPRKKLAVISQQLKPTERTAPQHYRRRRTSSAEAVYAKMDGWASDAESVKCSGCEKTFLSWSKKKNCRRCGEMFCDACCHREVPVPEMGYADPVPVCDRCLGWTPNSEASTCTGCNARFGVFRHRHHCRSCGECFCESCRPHKVAIPRLGYTEPVGVCGPCFRSLLTEQSEARVEDVKVQRVPLMLRNAAQLGFLTVNVVGAFDLTSGPAKKRATTFCPSNTGHALGPFVKLRIGDNGWMKTRLAASSPNPVWMQEFFFAVRPQDAFLLVQVVDETQAADDGLLGHMDMNFRKELEPGAKQIMRRKLGPPNAGEIELEIHFAVDASCLGDVGRSIIGLRR